MKMMRLIFTGLFLAPWLAGLGQPKMDCAKVKSERGVDIFTNEGMPLSYYYLTSETVKGTEVVFCPAGIGRSSPDDVRKRLAFDWKVKYNTIYLRTSDGLVIEGMNEHGFSASLMYLGKSGLQEKERKLIPIAASMAVNFFIDHFKSIDTVLLAVWDTRIFDDIGSECGWPFRIILHDSTGATAYIEHIEGDLRVFTPEAPAVITAAADFTRLVTIRHTPLYQPQSDAEKDFLYFDHFAEDPRDKAPEKIPAYFEKQGKIGEYYIFVKRTHENAGLYIESGGKKVSFPFNEVIFPADRETAKPLF